MRVIISTLLMCVAAHAATLAPPLPTQCTDTFCPQVVCPDGTESITPRGECCPTMCTCPVTFNPCQNGGSCVSTTFSGDPTCACAPGYIGKTCATGSCKYNGKIYLNGATFEATDGCNKCSCKDGMVGCTEMACHGCEHNGQWYDEGTSFMDKCNRCTCSGGVAACTKIACPGGGCNYNDQWYMNGATFTATDGCNSCTCTDGVVGCTEKACSIISPCATVLCAEPPCDESLRFTPDGECCPICSAVIFESCDAVACFAPTCDKSLVFTPEGECCPTCRATTNPCELVKCAAPPCDESMWFTPDGACCPTCKGCIVSGRKYNEGQRVRCKDPKCTTCTCRGGVVEVEPKTPCPRLTCARPITRRGQCCPECPKHRG